VPPAISLILTATPTLADDTIIDRTHTCSANASGGEIHTKTCPVFAGSKLLPLRTGTGNKTAREIDGLRQMLRKLADR